MNNQEVLKTIVALRIQLNLLEANLTGMPVKAGDHEILNMTFEEFCHSKLGGRSLISYIFDRDMSNMYEFYKFPKGPYEKFGEIPIWYFVKYCEKWHFLKIRGAGKNGARRISEKLAEFNIIWPRI